jgi:peptide deformylase
MLPTKIKRVLLEPDPRLRLPNAEVTAPWEELESWVRLMFKAMYRGTNGVGLAAPQVGWNVRLFIMNPDDKSFKPSAQRVFWNPVVAEKFGAKVLKREGCLSLPRCFGSIERWEVVRLKAVTPEGPVDCMFDGFEAQIIQHEVDHLNGRLCYEHWTNPVRKAIG